MSERQRLTFDHRGCTLTVVVTQIDEAWHSRFHMRCPIEGKHYTLSGREGPYSSPEEAFEKAKQWAVREIEQRMD